MEQKRQDFRRHCSLLPEAGPLGSTSGMETSVYLFMAAICFATFISKAGSVPREAAATARPRSAMPRSVSLRDGDSFEYIVVGAGAAGSALAARLALAGRDVLLVEAGGDPSFISKIPGAAEALLGSSIDYQYETISNNISCLSFQKQQCAFSRGRCLGGSTSINYMMYTRCNPVDFDHLHTPGWTWDDMKPYFLRYEGLKDMAKLPNSSKPYHNTAGEINLEFFSDSENPWHSRIIEGFKSLNFPYNPDVNAESQIGVSQVIGYVYENERMSAARGFLSRDEVKKRLKVAKFTRCTGVIIDDDRIAKGITVYTRSKKELKLFATKEVILSAGTLVTPQILMLSGIGHAEHLEKFNIPVVSDLPVGDNMTDHLLPLLFVKVDKGSGLDDEITRAALILTDIIDLIFHRKGPLTANGLTDVTAFVNSECYDFKNRQLLNDSSECEIPTLQYIHAYIDKNVVELAGPLFRQGTGLNDAVTKQLANINHEYGFIIFSPEVLHPFSQGNVRLASADPLAPPAIFPNFLSDDRDVDAMVQAITIVEHLMETPAFKENNASVVHLQLPGCPEYSSDREGYWRCYCRHMTHTAFHAVGTAALGRVVDARMRVRGVRRLRACDLAVLPALPRANTAAAAFALGEKLADLILTNK